MRTEIAPSDPARKTSLRRGRRKRDHRRGDGSRQGDRVDGLRPQAVERSGELLDAREQAVIGDQGQGREDESRGKRGQRGGQEGAPRDR